MMIVQVVGRLYKSEMRNRLGGRVEELGGISVVPRGDDGGFTLCLSVALFS